MDETPATVLIVDDDLSVREALSSLLRSVRLRTECFSSPHELLASDQIGAANCLVLDVRLPGRSGLDVLDELRELGVRLPTVVITGHGDIPMSVRAMKAGAVEFLIKPFRDQELLDAVQVALRLDHDRRREEDALNDLRERLDNLTARERDVLENLLRGQLNKEIGARLGVAESTIKAHRAQVMRKMRASSLPELVRMADRLGLGKT
jgi:FixJ family two-component response regulator